MFAILSAALFAMAAWPSARVRKTGLSGAIESRLARVGNAGGFQNVSIQPRPVIHLPRGVRVTRSFTFARKSSSVSVPSRFKVSSRAPMPKMWQCESVRPGTTVLPPTVTPLGEPWVATSLFNAFDESLKAYLQFMQQPHHLSFAWGAHYVEQERSLFGGAPFVQGLRANRHDLQTMIGFCEEQGVLERPLTVDELFTENTRGT